MRLSLSQQKLFFRQFLADFQHMGAILPSSPALGRAVAAYLARRGPGPVDVLEAGAGSGAFSREIIPLLRAGDSFDLVELNTSLIGYLKQRFAQEVAFQAEAGVHIQLINADLRALGPGKLYDYIIFSLPLTNFPPAMVQEILALMMERLKPGGVFSYVKYVFISRFKYWLGSRAVRQQMEANQAIIKRFADRYQVEQRLMWPNVPPTWVYYWQQLGKGDDFA